MILSALNFTAFTLNQYLLNKFGLTDNKVELNGIIGSDRKNPSENQNKLVLSLINIEKESNKAFYNSTQRLNNNNLSEISPVERYNLYIMVSSNFDDYKESLKFLDAGILFFQSHALLDSKSYASMPEGLNRLEFEIEKMSFHEMHSLWTALGTGYQPSVVYKMWLITIDPNLVKGFLKPINQPATKLTPDHELH